MSYLYMKFVLILDQYGYAQAKVLRSRDDNPRDMNKISYNQSKSRDTMILYVVTRVC